MKKVCELVKGQDIPEWLMVQTPTSPNAKAGTMTAQCRIVVYELDGDYWLMPDTFEIPPILHGNSTDIAIGAGNRRVIFPTNVEIFEVDGSGDTLTFEDYQKRG